MLLSWNITTTMILEDYVCFIVRPTLGFLQSQSEIGNRHIRQSETTTDQLINRSIDQSSELWEIVLAYGVNRYKNLHLGHL